MAASMWAPDTWAYRRTIDRVLWPLILWIVGRSIPASTSRVMAVCLMTWGVIFAGSSSARTTAAPAV